MFINVPIEVTCYQPETVGCKLIFIYFLFFLKNLRFKIFENTVMVF